VHAVLHVLARRSVLSVHPVAVGIHTVALGVWLAELEADSYISGISCLSHVAHPGEHRSVALVHFDHVYLIPLSALVTPGVQ
jgi:hypothetical protein